MHTLLQDIRYALRMLLKSPGFTVVALVTLALGIGANAVIFSVVNAVLLRPLPFAQPERLMMVFHSYPKLNLRHASVMPYALSYYKQNLKSFSSLGAVTIWRGPQNLIVDGEAQRVKTVEVSADFFPTLGVSPKLGRTFLPEEDKAGNNHEVVLSYALWQQQFGSDPQIVGKKLTLDGVNYGIVGVMPQGFQVPSRGELWTPLGFDAQEANSKMEYLTVIGRLKAGVSAQQAQAELDQTSEQLLRQFPELAPTGFHVITVPMAEVLQENLRPALLVLLGAVGCVLLIACANVANLLLVRATARQREIAIRATLGATRSRLTRQLLTESTLLSLFGGLLGVLLAYNGTAALLALAPIEIPSFVHINVDSHVLAFAVAISVITGLVFGLIPALHVSEGAFAGALKTGGRTSMAQIRDRVRNSLVVAEVGLALMLLVCAGLLVRTFAEVRHTDPGFTPGHTLTAWVALREAEYRRPEQAGIFFEQLLDRVSALPQVNSAAVSSTLPLISDWTQSFQIQGKDFQPEPHAFFAAVSPGYFKALGIPLLRGRTFLETDSAAAAPVAIVDERAARSYWPGEDPVGKLINKDILPGTDQKPVWRVVVGVVGSVKHASALADENKGQVYLPYLQNPMRTMNIVVRTQGDATAFGPALRHEVAQLDANQAVYDVLTMDYMLRRSIAEPRFNMVLLGLFAGLALALSAVGIYGVISYWVSQRTQEMGIRMALGAARADVLRLVLLQTIRLVAVGLLLGVAGSLLATRALSTLLYRVGVHDPLTFAAIVVLLSLVGLLAGYLPARRATRVDPIVALRCE